VKRVFKAVAVSAFLFTAFNCINAQSILSIASKLETGIKTNLPQCEMTDVRVSSKKSEQGAILFHLSCAGQWMSLNVIEHESADQARGLLREALAKVDPALYRTIELPNLGDEGYTFANWDGSKPGLGTLNFRIGKVWFGVTARSDEMAQSVAKAVSTFMRDTLQPAGAERGQSPS